MEVGKNNSDFSLLGRKNGAAHGAVITYYAAKRKTQASWKRAEGGSQELGVRSCSIA